MILEVEKTFCNGVKVVEIIRSKNLSLDDGEVDFNLVEPTGMNRTVHKNQSGVLVLEALDRSHSAMG